MATQENPRVKQCDSRRMNVTSHIDSGHCMLIRIWTLLPAAMTVDLALMKVYPVPGGIASERIQASPRHCANWIFQIAAVSDSVAEDVLIYCQEEVL